ncbi:MAG: alpha/beta fold hydrolase [Alphaproteobacteria bacterium]|nr:alpha/beta fold hydrolase [Alphaproteobacteria bacterium]
MAAPRVALPQFIERRPWLGGDLQTVRNSIRGVPPLVAAETAMLELALGDGSGDRLAAVVDRPARPLRPPVVLVHGLTGCAASRYVLASAGHFLALGHPVVRLNLRGAGPSRALARGHYHAGRSADLRAALAALPRELVRDGAFLVGYSLGANVVLKLLGEGDAPGVLAAVAVSAPIDLAAASRRLRMARNAGYHRYLLARMKAEMLAGPLDARTQAMVRAVADVYAFDDRVVAPAAGFTGADDYYARCSAAGYLGAIAVPTLVIHATNDPWIPADAYWAYPWADNPWLLPALLPGGGHVGFHGRGSAVPWHDRAAAAFFGAISR